MTFFNEPWFWTGIFPVAAILLKTWMDSRAQVKVERMRLHEKERFEAYKRLYGFIASAEGFFLEPTDDDQGDFIDLMKAAFVPIKPDSFWFPSGIRKILKEFEDQYECSRNPDLNPPVTFNEFISKHMLNGIKQLRMKAESWTDKILH